MRVGMWRFVIVACAALVFVATNSAQAQSVTSSQPVAASVNLDASQAVMALASAERKLAASGFAPKVNVNFMPAARQGFSGAADSGIGVGVLAMIIRTSYSSDDVGNFFDLSNRTGYGFGLWVGGNRNGPVGFTGEFIYLIHGDDELKTRALQIPAVLHVNFGSRSRNSAGGYIVLGPSFTINLRQEAFGLDVSDYFNGADIGIIAGVGVEFFRIGIEGRGNWGLRNIDNTGAVNDIKTFTFELLGKFAFN